MACCAWWRAARAARRDVAPPSRCFVHADDQVEQEEQPVAFAPGQGLEALHLFAERGCVAAASLEHLF
jgi:hypothetical protein